MPKQSGGKLLSLQMPSLSSVPRSESFIAFAKASTRITGAATSYAATAQAST